MSAEVKPKAPPIGYTLEGGGTVATCKRCGWEVWRPTRLEAAALTTAHKCRADLVKLWKRLRKGVWAKR
jgi:hypothetical protein